MPTTRSMLFSIGTVALLLLPSPHPAKACCGPPEHPGLWQALVESDVVVAGKPQPAWPELEGGAQAVAPWIDALEQHDRTMRRLYDKLGKLGS